MGFYFSRETTNAIACTAGFVIQALQLQFSWLRDIEWPQESQDNTSTDFERPLLFEEYCQNYGCSEEASQLPQHTQCAIYTFYIIALMVQDYTVELQEISIISLLLNYLESFSQTEVNQGDALDTFLKGVGLVEHKKYFEYSKEDQQCFMNCIHIPCNEAEKYCQELFNSTIQYFSKQDFGELPRSNLGIKIVTGLLSVVPLLRWPRYLQCMIDSALTLLQNSKIDWVEGNETSQHQSWVYVFYVVRMFTVYGIDTIFGVTKDYTSVIRLKFIMNALKRGDLQQHDLLQVDWQDQYLKPGLRHDFATTLSGDNTTTQPTPWLSNELATCKQNIVSFWLDLLNHWHTRTLVVALWKDISQFISINFNNIVNTSYSLVQCLEKNRPISISQVDQKPHLQSYQDLDHPNERGLKKKQFKYFLSQLWKKRKTNKAIKKTMKACFVQQCRRVYTYLSILFLNSKLIDSLTWDRLISQYILPIVKDCLQITQEYQAKHRSQFSTEQNNFLTDHQTYLSCFSKVLLHSQNPFDIRLRETIRIIVESLLTIIQNSPVAFPDKAGFLAWIDGMIRTMEDVEQANSSQREIEQAMEAQLWELLAWINEHMFNHQGIIQATWAGAWNWFNGNERQPSIFDQFSEYIGHCIQKGTLDRMFHAWLTTLLDSFLSRELSLKPPDPHDANSMYQLWNQQLKWLNTQLYLLGQNQDISDKIRLHIYQLFRVSKHYKLSLIHLKHDLHEPVSEILASIIKSIDDDVMPVLHLLCSINPALKLPDACLSSQHFSQGSRKFERVTKCLETAITLLKQESKKPSHSIDSSAIPFLLKALTHIEEGILDLEQAFIYRQQFEDIQYLQDKVAYFNATHWMMTEDFLVSLSQKLSSLFPKQFKSDALDHNLSINRYFLMHVTNCYDNLSKWLEHPIDAFKHLPIQTTQCMGMFEALSNGLLKLINKLKLDDIKTLENIIKRFEENIPFDSVQDRGKYYVVLGSSLSLIKQIGDVLFQWFPRQLDFNVLQTIFLTTHSTLKGYAAAQYLIDVLNQVIKESQTHDMLGFEVFKNLKQTLCRYRLKCDLLLKQFSDEPTPKTNNAMVLGRAVTSNSNCLDSDQEDSLSESYGTVDSRYNSDTDYYSISSYHNNNDIFSKRSSKATHEHQGHNPVFVYSLSILVITHILWVLMEFIAATAIWSPLVYMLLVGGIGSVWLVQWIDLRQQGIHTVVSDRQRYGLGLFSTTLSIMLSVYLWLTPLAGVTFLVVFLWSLKVILAAFAWGMLATQCLLAFKLAGQRLEVLSETTMAINSQKFQPTQISCSEVNIDGNQIQYLQIITVADP